MSKSSLVRQRKSPRNFSAYASFLWAKYPLDLCFKKLLAISPQFQNLCSQITKWLSRRKWMMKWMLRRKVDFDRQSWAEKGRHQEGATGTHHHWSRLCEEMPTLPSKWMCSCPFEAASPTERSQMARLPLVGRWRISSHRTYLCHLHIA